MADLKKFKVAGALPATPQANSEYHLKVNDRVEMYVTDSSGNAYPVREQIVEQINGEWLLDPNEINSGTTQGTYDNRLQGDLGNVGAANLVRTTAGYVYPFDVKLTGFIAHHNNSAGGNDPWGFVFYAIERNDNSNTVTTTFLRDESFDRGEGHFGLRDYANNTNQTTILNATDFVDVVIPAGQIIFLGVGAPTADTTNNYVRISGGCFIFEKQ